MYKGRPPTLTKELKALEESIKKAYADTENSAVLLFALLSDAYCRKLHEAVGYSTLAEYLSAILRISTRSARDADLTVRVFVHRSLPAETYQALGPTRARDIASLASRTEMTTDALKTLVATVIKQDWTAAALERYVDQQVKRQPADREGLGPDPDREPRSRRVLPASDTQWDAIRTAAAECADMSGTHDLTTIIEYAVQELANSQSNHDGQEGVAFRQHLLNATRVMHQISAAACELGDGDESAKRKASRLFDELQGLALFCVLSMGPFVSPEIENAPRLLRHARNSATPPLTEKACRQTAAIIVALLCRVYAVDESLVEAAVDAINSQVPAEVRP